MKIELKKCTTPYSNVKIGFLKKLSKIFHNKYTLNYPYRRGRQVRLG